MELQFSNNKPIINLPEGMYHSGDIVVKEGVLEGISKDGLLIVRAGDTLISLKPSAEMLNAEIGSKIKLILQKLNDGSLFFDIDSVVAKTIKGIKKPIEADEKVKIDSLRLLLSSMEKSIKDTLADNGDKKIVFLKSIDDMIGRIAGDTRSPLMQKELPVLLQKIIEDKNLSPQLIKIAEKLHRELQGTFQSERVAARPVMVLSSAVAELPPGIVNERSIVGVVDEIRADGKVMISLDRKQPIPFSVPVPVVKGDKLELSPVGERALSIDKLVVLNESNNHLSVASPRVIIDRVLAEPEFAAARATIPEAELRQIEKSVVNAVRGYNLTEKDIDSMVRVLLKIATSPSVSERLRPEIVHYGALKNIGETLLRSLSLLSDVRQNLPENIKQEFDKVFSAMRMLADPLVVDKADQTATVNVLRLLEEKTGMKFEHKLMQLFSSGNDEKSTIAARLKGDFKANIIFLLTAIDKADMPTNVKDNIKADLHFLLNQADIAQLRNASDNEWRHMFIPVIENQEHKSAHVAFRRRGKKGTVDPDNNSIIIRVSPSAIGDMETSVHAVDGKLFVKFLVQSEGAAGLFRKELSSVAERLDALGFYVASISADVWNGDFVNIESFERTKSSAGGFDITV